MPNRSLATIAAGLGLALASWGCGWLTGPKSGDEVEITLAVSGGLAGVDWQYTIDGRSGRVTGDRCVGDAGCDWEAGQELATFDPHWLISLADEFFDRGFFRGPVNYGSVCCDFFDYVLTYRDDRHDRTLQGGGGSLPVEILGLIDLIEKFVDRVRS